MLKKQVLSKDSLGPGRLDFKILLGLLGPCRLFYPLYFDMSGTQYSNRQHKISSKNAEMFPIRAEYFNLVRYRAQSLRCQIWESETKTQVKLISGNLVHKHLGVFITYVLILFTIIINLLIVSKLLWLMSLFFLR